MDVNQLISDFAKHAESAGVTVESIVRAYFDSNPCDWRVYAKIIPDYMPPYPRPDTRPRCVVEFRGQFLRYSCGPRQRCFWDGYGDDFQTPGLALKALMEAECPCILWYTKAHNPSRPPATTRAGD